MRRLVAIVGAALIAVCLFVAPVPLLGKFALLLVGLAALDSLSAALGFGVLANTGGSFANLTSALKRRYDDNFLGEVGWSKGPLAAMIRKVAWSGSNPVWSNRVGNSPARSATYSVAAAKSEDTTYGFTRVKQWTGTWMRDYGRATIDGLLLATAGDKLGSFYDKFVAQLDGALDATMHSFSTKIYRGGFGGIGQISAGTNLAGNVITLAVPEDVVFYEIGQDLQFAQFENSGALRNAGAVLTVTNVNFTSTNGVLVGTVTVNANLNTVTGLLAGDWIFSSGDRQNNASPAPTAIQGLAAWGNILNNAFTAPTPGENFFGNDRSTDSRLSFVYFDARGMSEEEALIKSTVESIRFGGRPGVHFLNPTRYGNLLVQGQSKLRPVSVEGPFGLGFEGVALRTPKGEVECYPDPYCQSQFGWTLQMDTLRVYAAGTTKVPDFITADGNKILRQSADDGIECRVGYYGVHGCNAPVKNTVVQYA
jgi:hypothetical protein